MYISDPLFSPLPAPDETAAWDSLAEKEYALPGLLLMENAGRAAFELLKAEHGLRPGLEALVLAGKGNNGGDGLVLARYLHNAGCLVTALTLGPEESYRDAALAHYRAAKAAGVRLAVIPRPYAAPETELLVDALLGTGFQGPLRGPLPELISSINNLRGAWVCSLDIPSGLNALNGLPEPCAVRASLTAALAAPKPGLCLPWARPYTGRLRVLDIGLPPALLQASPPARRLVRPRPGLLPKTFPYAHKGQKGRVLVIGGSSGLSGAPLLSALGAARAGVGLVSIASPAPCCRDFQKEYPEIMTLPLKAENWTEVCSGPVLRDLLDLISGLPDHSALALGPGLGREEAVAALVRAVLSLKRRPPLVLDADGLRHCRAVPAAAAEEPFISLDALREDDVLTPHPAEIIRLLSGTTQAGAALNPASGKPFSSGDLCGQEAREAALSLAISHTRATVLLKGPGTLVARRGRPLSLIACAESNLAVGGSGDILTGLVAALLARRPLPDSGGESIAALGAYLHARAGKICARAYPAGGNLASDIAEAIPAALRETA
ncbi:MAG: NAD(P)H-hydrate dehydratase [Deltaproteobacteria bacterium]|jgi:NAD(P)H-hydrate epimerase|nr:NAD(P)H-hydrate dehydratase [Deltaproteobacteria bacterium]